MDREFIKNSANLCGFLLAKINQTASEYNAMLQNHKKIKQILVIGENIGRTKQRVGAMRRLGYTVDVLSSVPENLRPGINENIIFCDRVWNKLGFPRDKTRLNQHALKNIANNKPDLIWVEKLLILKPATLRIIRKTYPDLKIAWFSEDDMFARHNQSVYFLQSLHHYDVMYTTKSYNCDSHELPALGAKKVILVNQSFDPAYHRPITLTTEDIKKFGADAGFIGTFENDRFEKMLFLAKNNIRVRVWGNGWQHVANTHAHLKIENKPIYDEDYIKAICATKINLCFLRKINRDLQTARTMEIPACGAFMLAERTHEHLKLFQENREAVYFDIQHPSELLEKVIYYLSRDADRKIIADAGLKRCINSQYSHDDRLREMFECLE